MILFDLTATQPKGGAKRHGGGKYGESVLRKIMERNLPVACFYDSANWLNPEIRNLISHVTLYDLQKNSIDEIVTDSKCTAIYSALPSYNLFSFRGCKLIATIHGLRRLETPADLHFLKYRNVGIKALALLMFQRFMPDTYRQLLCKHKMKEWNNPNLRFITVSNHSACSIKTFFPSFRDKEIPVFYSPSTSSSTAKTETVYDNKYFLLVSANRPDKNNLRAIEAFDLLFSNGFLQDIKVKITGAKDQANFRYKIRNIDRFEFLGYVDDDTLEQLYHDAYALVYPSLNEGFGYPPLEAMRYGVPVIASPYTSIPEVCGNAAMYFNPLSVEEIAARIIHICNPEIYQRQSNNALQQYKLITEIQNRDLDALVDYIYKV